ncbi:MAG: MFS transporter [Anaerolineales bacterium]
MATHTRLHRWLARQRSSPIAQALTLNTVWFGVSFLWNAIHPIVLPTLLVNIREDAQNTSYGLLTFAGLVVAAVVQPISGALSDRTTHRLGKRRPWMLLGLASGLACLWLMMLARDMWALALGYVLLQCSSNILHGAAQGLIPDLTPTEQHGLASGLKNLLDMLGLVTASLVISRMAGGATPQLPLAAVVISAVWAAGVLCTVCGLVEPTTTSTNTAHSGIGAALRHDWGVRGTGHGDYARLLLARFCLLFGVYVVEAFAYFYFVDVLHLADPAKAVGNIMTVIGVALIISTVPAGVVSERFGRRRLSLLAEGVVFCGLIGLAIWRAAHQLWVWGVVIGLGMGIFVSVNWAWATDLVPKQQAAGYLGLSNLATAGAAALSRLMGPVIDLVNAQRHDAGYSLLFVIAIIGAGIAFFVTRGIRETRQVVRVGTNGSDCEADPGSGPGSAGDTSPIDGL